jgi:hypothetical protein
MKHMLNHSIVEESDGNIYGGGGRMEVIRRKSRLHSPPESETTVPSRNSDSLSKNSDDQSSLNNIDQSSEFDDVSEAGSLLSDRYSRNGENKAQYSKQFALLKQKASSKINAMKTQIAVLQETIDKSRATDIEMLEGKLRTHQNDIVSLRQRNTELRETIQQLETKLFDAMKDFKKRIKYRGDNLILVTVRQLQRAAGEMPSIQMRNKAIKMNFTRPRLR